jgi:hypothetical protein
VSRAERKAYERELRAVLDRENMARRTGDWGPWVDVPADQLPASMPAGARGWVKEITRVFTNRFCAVLIRPVQTAWGPVEHLCICTASNTTTITWAEKQRIKNEVSGLERTAIEVFPAVGRLVDGANAYHLWVLPDGFAMPFGLHREDG